MRRFRSEKQNEDVRVSAILTCTISSFTCNFVTLLCKWNHRKVLILTIICWGGKKKDNWARSSKGAL